MAYYPRIKPTGMIRRIKEYTSTRDDMIYTLSRGVRVHYDGGLTGKDDDGRTWYMISNGRGETVGFALEEHVNLNSPMYPPC